jgi:hypothetical protein
MAFNMSTMRGRSAATVQVASDVHCVRKFVEAMPIRKAIQEHEALLVEDEAWSPTTRGNDQRVPARWSAAASS